MMHHSDNSGTYLLPEIVHAIEKLAPSGEMFADGIRLAGLDVLSRLGIREGIPLCIQVIDPSRWGQGGRLPRCLEYLARYGGHAKEFVPQLKEIRGQLGKSVDNIAMMDKTIAAIEGGTQSPALIGMEDFRKSHAQP